MAEEDRTGSGASRRRILGLLGGGTVGTVYFGSGLARATPGHGGGPPEGRGGVGPCTCEEPCPEDSFCGKVEGQPEAGATYTFSEDGGEYSVTIDRVETKENEDEVTCFAFSSDDDVDRVCIKGGPDTNTYTEPLDGETLCAPINPGGQQSEISNFSFCGAPAECFQLDLVGGEPLESFDGQSYSTQNRLVADFFVCTDETKFQTGATGTAIVDGTECTFSWDAFTFEGDVASVEVTLESVAGDETECQGTLAAYSLPEGVEEGPGSLEEQEFFGADTEALAEGDTVTLSIDLDPD